MSQLNTLSTSQNLERILDENNCPVARMRLFSQGIQTNNRIVMYEPITGDKGCLTCGNCIDACPVVREKRRFVFVQNQRTSMALENIVGDECRRCYACVKACPQVSKTTKEFVWGFRRGEKFVHVYVASLIIFLAGTGIFAFHFNEVLPGWQQLILKASHVFAGFLLLMAPLLYFLLDRSHMKRALKNVFRFGEADLAWLKDFKAYLKSPRRRSLPVWTEFNTYHKFWFSYLLVILPVLGLTGIEKPAEHPVDGVDLTPLLTGKTDKLPHREVYCFYPKYAQYKSKDQRWAFSWRNVIYDGDQKLIEYPEYGEYELFDLAADPKEETDRSTSHPEQRDTLTRKLHNWLKEIKAPPLESNPDYKSGQ